MIIEIVVAVVLDIVVVAIVVLIHISYPHDSELAFQHATMVFSVQKDASNVYSLSLQGTICCDAHLARC